MRPLGTRILSYKKQLIRNTSGISGNNKKQALVNPKTLRNIALVKILAVINICSFSNSLEVNFPMSAKGSKGFVILIPNLLLRNRQKKYPKNKSKVFS